MIFPRNSILALTLLSSSFFTFTNGEGSEDEYNCFLMDEDCPQVLRTAKCTRGTEEFKVCCVGAGIETNIEGVTCELDIDETKDLGIFVNDMEEWVEEMADSWSTDVKCYENGQSTHCPMGSHHTCHNKVSGRNVKVCCPEGQTDIYASSLYENCDITKSAASDDAESVDIGITAATDSASSPGALTKTSLGLVATAAAAVALWSM